MHESEINGSDDEGAILFKEGNNPNPWPDEENDDLDEEAIANETRPSFDQETGSDNVGSVDETEIQEEKDQKNEEEGEREEEQR